MCHWHLHKLDMSSVITISLLRSGIDVYLDTSIQHPTGLVEKMVRPLNSTKGVVSTKTVVCCRCSGIEHANANYVVVHIMIHGYGWVLF